MLQKVDLSQAIAPARAAELPSLMMYDNNLYRALYGLNCWRMSRFERTILDTIFNLALKYVE